MLAIVPRANKQQDAEIDGGGTFHDVLDLVDELLEAGEHECCRDLLKALRRDIGENRRRRSRPIDNLMQRSLSRFVEDLAPELDDNQETAGEERLLRRLRTYQQTFLRACSGDVLAALSKNLQPGLTERLQHAKTSYSVGSEQAAKEDQHRGKRPWYYIFVNPRGWYRENVRPLPWIPREEDVGGKGARLRLFYLFEDSSKSLIGKLISFVVMLAIFASTVAFLVESEPEFRERPPLCAELRAAGKPLTPEACEPQPKKEFKQLETACVAVFTVDYMIRILTVHSSAPAGTSGLYKTLRYAKDPLNIIDFIAIFPYYMKLIADASASPATVAVRVLRLARVLRLFKMAKHNYSIDIFSQVLILSGQPLFVLLFFNSLIVIVTASLIYFAEGQAEYSVSDSFKQQTELHVENTLATADYSGVFVRSDQQHTALEVTPFRSIPHSIWWVCTTMTTVGYGDMFPTTAAGKCIGCLCFYIGILFLSLPISVLGTNFEIVYGEIVGDMTARHSRKHRRTQAKQVDHSRWLPQGASVRKRLFFLFDQSESCRLSRVISVAGFLAIIVSTISFIFESMPEFNYSPPSCQLQALKAEECRPVPDHAFFVIEAVCVAIFTIDYVVRVLTVHAAKPEECGLRLHRPHKNMSGFTVTRLYCCQFLNIVDLFAIVPFYVSLVLDSGTTAGISVLRVLRLIRIFRVLKNPKLQSGAALFINVIEDSLPAILILIFMMTLSCVFFASLIVFAEGSQYSVDFFPEDFPEGCYVRPTVDGHGIEQSPFRSVPYAFWWFFVTATTVGFGDDYPTTALGRVVAVCAFYAGITFLALPLAVVGASFNCHYGEWMDEFQKKKKPATDSPTPAAVPAQPPKVSAPEAPKASPAPTPKPEEGMTPVPAAKVTAATPEDNAPKGAREAW